MLESLLMLFTDKVNGEFQLSLELITGTETENRENNLEPMGTGYQLVQGHWSYCVWPPRVVRQNHVIIVWHKNGMHFRGIWVSQPEMAGLVRRKGSWPRKEPVEVESDQSQKEWDWGLETRSFSPLSGDSKSS